MWQRGTTCACQIAILRLMHIGGHQIGFLVSLDMFTTVYQRHIRHKVKISVQCSTRKRRRVCLGLTSKQLYLHAVWKTLPYFHDFQEAIIHFVKQQEYWSNSLQVRVNIRLSQGLDGGDDILSSPLITQGIDLALGFLVKEIIESYFLIYLIWQWVFNSIHCVEPMYCTILGWR